MWSHFPAKNRWNRKPKNIRLFGIQISDYRPAKFKFKRTKTVTGSFRRKGAPACSGSFALQCGGFVPREWPPANGLLGTTSVTPYKGNNYLFKIFHRFWLAQSARRILHTWRWPILEDASNILSIRWFCLGNEVDRWWSMVYWFGDDTGWAINRPSISVVSRRGDPAIYSRVYQKRRWLLSKDEIAKFLTKTERNESKNTQNTLLDVCFLLL